MSAYERFRKLVDDFLVRSLGDEIPSGNQLMLELDGRRVHLGFLPEREEIVVSTMVYFAVDEPENIRPEAIAQFNAYHLFHGGYRLAVDQSSQCLYVSQNKPLARAEAAGLDALLGDFIGRCASCTRWYFSETLSAGLAAHRVAQSLGAPGGVELPII